MSNVTAVCTIGYPCAGKSEVTHMASTLGMETYSMGDELRSRAIKEYGEAGVENEGLLGRFATEQRTEHGQGVVAEWMVETLQEDTEPGTATRTVAIDGIRSMDEIEVLREQLSEFIVIHVFAPFETRLERLLDRGRGSEAGFVTDGGTIHQSRAEEYLKERDRREESWGMREFIDNEHYDVRIDNTGSLEDFREKITTVLEPFTVN